MSPSHGSLYLSIEKNAAAKIDKDDSEDNDNY